MNTEYGFSLALITGATSGIGEALARLIASKGIPLLLTGRNRDQLDKLAQELSSFVPVETLAVELRDKSQRKKLVELIQTKKPNLVINNAGLGWYGETYQLDNEKSLDLIEVNVAALTELSVEAARTWVASNQKGVILNVSSAAATVVFPGFAVYSASKAYVNQFSLSLDEEMSPYGIRVLISCPGVIATRFRERAGGQPNLTLYEKWTTMTPKYAAEQIWNQIIKRKKIVIFNSFYRIMIGLASFLPRSWVAASTASAIKRIRGKKE